MVLTGCLSFLELTRLTNQPTNQPTNQLFRHREIDSYCSCIDSNLNMSTLPVFEIRFE